MNLKRMLKRNARLLIVSFSMLFFFLSLTGISAAQETSLTELPNQPTVICQPGTTGANQDFCVAIPAQTTGGNLPGTEVSGPAGKTGSVFAPKTIDPELSVVPYSYAKLNLESFENAPLYGSAADAIAGTNPINVIPAGGIRYVSYVNRVDSGGGHYVQTKEGAWLRASPALIPTATLGRTFDTTPPNYFGWVFESCNPYREPNYNNGIDTTVWYNREEVLEVFEIVQNESSIWFKVGENQWMDRIHFRVARFNTTTPAGVLSDRWIELDLQEQVVMVYDKNELVYATMVATGMEPFYTQPGVFQIYEKKEVEDMTGAFEADKSDFYSLQDVPFALYHDQERAFHGAYWRAWYGFEQSHGCINMSIGDAHWLYNWANIGDYVYIHDPSGVTPTDPSYYGAGGA
ncbi:MAG: L,D-transpeptidase [Chloroflexi bacterium]|nr:L,D-transpeptidase [Chloroflexota bacterium]